MSGTWLTPASPGTVSPAHLEKVHELHGAVRAWIDTAATAQKNEHIKATLPYVDLTFAFGFATLGDHATAKKLVEDARKVAEVPIPQGGTAQTDQAVTAALVKTFLFQAFQFRVEEALAGKPHAGRLSARVLSAFDAIVQTGGRGPINNSYKLAVYVINRFRMYSRIVEPQERVDPYFDWDRVDQLKGTLSQLPNTNDPGTLADSIRRLLSGGADVRLTVLHRTLSLATRVGEDFAIELLNAVPSVLKWNDPNPSKQQDELLEQAFFLAGYFHRPEIAAKLVDALIRLVRSTPEAFRTLLVAQVARNCLTALSKCGHQAETNQFVNTLRAEVMHGAALPELRTRYTAVPERWAATVRAHLALAGTGDMSAQALEAARRELLGSDALPLQPYDYTELARAYVLTLGDGSPEAGLIAMLELFKRMPPTKITNTWTTAQYYSRFHLNLVEDTVLALCQPCPESPVPLVVTA
jgi:hypothetical protein